MVRRRYGINICSDTQFPEPTVRVAAQGATLLLVAAKNMMRRPVATPFKDLHHRMRAERAYETGMWLVSADVTGTRENSVAEPGVTSSRPASASRCCWLGGSMPRSRPALRATPPTW